jgi:hypothetical protein
MKEFDGIKGLGFHVDFVDNASKMNLVWIGKKSCMLDFEFGVSCHHEVRDT